MAWLTSGHPSAASLTVPSSTPPCRWFVAHHPCPAHAPRQQSVRAQLPNFRKPSSSSPSDETCPSDDPPIDAPTQRLSAHPAFVGSAPTASSPETRSCSGRPVLSASWRLAGKLASRPRELFASTQAPAHTHLHAETLDPSGRACTDPHYRKHTPTNTHKRSKHRRPHSTRRR